MEINVLYVKERKLKILRVGYAPLQLHGNFVPVKIHNWNTSVNCSKLLIVIKLEHFFKKKSQK